VAQPIQPSDHLHGGKKNNFGGTSGVLNASSRDNDRIAGGQHDVTWLTTPTDEIIIAERNMDLLAFVTGTFDHANDLQSIMPDVTEAMGTHSRGK